MAGKNSKVEVSCLSLGDDREMYLGAAWAARSRKVFIFKSSVQASVFLPLSDSK